MVILTTRMPPQRVVDAARSWIGTPYHHQACLKHIGTDCLGLLRGLYGELYDCAVPVAPAYTRDWAEALGEETLLKAADQFLVRSATTLPSPGDVLCFRFRRHAPAKHVGIAVSADRFVHAVEGAHVHEVALVPGWRRRIAAVYHFPLEKP